MPRNSLKVRYTEQSPKEIAGQLDGIDAIVIPFESPKDLENDPRLVAWIEKFKQLADEAVGRNQFPPTVVVVADNLEFVQTVRLQNLGAIVFDIGRDDGFAAFQRFLDNLRFEEDAHVLKPTKNDEPCELDEDTKAYLNSEPEGLSKLDRRILLELLEEE